MKTSDIKTRAQFYEFANIWYRRAIKLHSVWKDRSRSEVDRNRAFELSFKMQKRILKLNKIAIELNKINIKPKFAEGGEVKQVELKYKHDDFICSKSLDVCMYIGPANRCLGPINGCVHQVYRNTQKITNTTPKKQSKIKLPGNKVIVGVVCPTKGDFKKWCSEVGEKSYRNAKFIHIYKVKHVNYRRFYAIEGGYNFENVDPVVFQEACYRIK